MSAWFLIFRSCFPSTNGDSHKLEFYSRHIFSRIPRRPVIIPLDSGFFICIIDRIRTCRIFFTSAMLMTVYYHSHHYNVGLLQLFSFNYYNTNLWTQTKAPVWITNVPSSVSRCYLLHSSVARYWYCFLKLFSSTIFIFASRPDSHLRFSRTYIT